MSRFLLLRGAPEVESELAAPLASADFVVPLTFEADQWLEEPGERRVGLNDLIPHDRICKLAEVAQEALERWALEACSGGTFDGIDWPALFISEQQQLFFRELFMGWELAEALRRRGCRQATLTSAGASEPHEPRFAFAAGLRAGLGTALTVGPARGTRAAGWTRWRNRARSGWRRLGSVVSRPSWASPQREVVAVFATSEWRRFSDALVELNSAFGSHFAIWYLGSLDRDLRHWAATAGIALASVPYPPRISPAVARFVGDHWLHWQTEGRRRLAAAFDCPALADDALAPSFALWFNYTLARAIEWGRNLRAMLRAAQPAWLVGSAASTYMTSFPYRVAAGEGIPSIGLSHTYVPGDSFPVDSTYLVCRNRLEREGYRRSLPEDDRVLYCRNACDPVSYPSHSTLSLAEGDRRIVALLTASPSPAGLTMPWVDLTDYRAVLDGLLQPPAELADLDFAIKGHPRFDILGAIEGRPRAANVFLVPGLDPIVALLEAAWAVVVFNHYGSVAADAAASDRPVLFLDSGGFCQPCVETHAFAAGEVLRDLAGLWSTLARLRDSVEYHRELTDRARRFAANQLAPAMASVATELQRLSVAGEFLGTARS